MTALHSLSHDLFSINQQAALYSHGRSYLTARKKEAAQPPAMETTSILKPDRPYDPTADADLQFFPQERPEQIDPQDATPEDPTAAGDEDDYDDPDGALWSGPAARSVPTSVSGFRMRARSRQNLNRDLARTESEYESGAEDDDDARSRRTSRSRRTQKSTRSRRRRRKSTASRTTDAESESEDGVGFFEGLSNVLRGRSASNARRGSSPSRTRPSLHSRSSFAADDAVSLTSEDPYGPYGSTSEEDDDTRSDTSSSSSLERRGGLPGLTGHAGDFFGESRIDFEDDDEMSSISESSDGGDEPGGPMCHQLVYIVDEDLPLRFVGLHLSRWWLALWYLGCVVTVGGLWLVGRWLPNLWRKATGEMEIFAESDYVVVEVRFFGT